ncbi:MAG TPA: hypothetical protein VN047_09510 [Sphingopyxis sp.]|uniref:hypothetical protein n=1 Tax=Sphingopyxis sp. TaxID=1908224 RepID=UPI002BE8D2CA|nr:hypothetical protein [Sphingopyxis sp.]HWW57115.1 hypothetical protein [Sphingopyxis sp.]
MTIQIFICDTPAALVTTLGELAATGRSKVIYQTPDAAAETGDVIRYLVKPPRSPGAKLESYAGKYLIVAVRD